MFTGVLSAFRKLQEMGVHNWVCIVWWRHVRRFTDEGTPTLDVHSSVPQAGVWTESKNKASQVPNSLLLPDRVWCVLLSCTCPPCHDGLGPVKLRDNLVFLTVLSDNTQSQQWWCQLQQYWRFGEKIEPFSPWRGGFRISFLGLDSQTLLWKCSGFPCGHFKYHHLYYFSDNNFVLFHFQLFLW